MKIEINKKNENLGKAAIRCPSHSKTKSYNKLPFTKGLTRHLIIERIYKINLCPGEGVPCS